MRGPRPTADRRSYPVGKMDPVPAYSEAFLGTVDAIKTQIASGTAPSAVAARILAAIEGKYRMRHPADRGARLLSVLRRLAPSGAVDKGIRSTFGLKV